MGSLDSNGIYIYDGNDQLVPHAALLNLLATSVSAAIDDVRSDNVYRHMIKSSALSVTDWGTGVLGGLTTTRARNFPANSSDAFVIPRDGRYLVSASVAVQGGITGRVGIRYTLNGSTAQTGGAVHRVDSSSPNVGYHFRISFSEPNYYEEGDVIQFQAVNYTNETVGFAVGGQRNLFSIDYIGAL